MAEPARMNSFDIAVVGAGPCGLAAGIAARHAQFSCVLFDKECVAASISRYPTHMTFFSTAERLEIGGVPFIVAGEKPTRREALRYYQRLAREFALDVRQYQTVREISADSRGFRIATTPQSGVTHTLHARNVVIASGYFDSPNRLGIPGEDLAKVAHNYREGHVFYDQDCVVVGGGNSAVDAALELQRWGARVTIIHFGAQLDPNVKPWVRPEIEARIRDGDIRALFQARITEIRPDEVIVREPAGEQRLANDWVLAMTGYTPDGTLLRSLGVEFDPETGIPSHDPGTMETNVQGVFIAGVLAAGYNANKVFIENGRDHGARIVERVKSRVDTPRSHG